MFLAFSTLSACGEKRTAEEGTTVIREPNQFASIDGYVSEIVRITALTEERAEPDLYRAKCETLYSSAPERPGRGTVYFAKTDLGMEAVGQTVCVFILPHSARDSYAVSDMLFMKDDFFHLDENVDCFNLRMMNELVSQYADHPNENIPSIPQTQLLGAVTVAEMSEFLERMSAACTEWETAYRK